MRRSLVGFSVTIFATAATFTAGLPSGAAAEDRCLNPPHVWMDGEPVEPLLTTVSRPLPIEVQVYDGEIECGGMTVTVQRPNGTNVTSVQLTEKGYNEYPTIYTRRGYLAVPLATGLGDWVMTKVTHGGNELAVNEPFRVRRGTEVTVDQPARTSGTARTTVSGLLRRYTSMGVLAPAGGVIVRVMHQNGTTLLATTRTASNGRYAVAIPFTQNTGLYASVAESGDYAGDRSGWVMAHKLLAMSYLTAATTATVNNYWKVSGTAFPGRLFTALDYWNGSAWAPTYSFGYVAADGSYARYWKPGRAGTFRLRVTVSGAGLDNSPWSRETTVTVRQLPQSPTYLTGTIAPTAGPPIRHWTTMSTFGFLKYRRADGTLGPVGNQILAVYTKGTGETTWNLVMSTRTTVTGYFSTNWTVFYGAGETFTAIIDYRTALPQAAGTTSRVFGPFTVQP